MISYTVEEAILQDPFEDAEALAWIEEQGDDLLSPAMCAARPAEGGAPPEALKRAAVSRGVNTYAKSTDHTRLIKQGPVSPGVCGAP